MDPDRWKRAARLFHDALDRLPVDRAAFLNDACAGDVALRDEVASLLAAHDAAGDFIDVPAVATAADVLFEDVSLAAGDRLGPFVIERLLARGGMGIVYRATDTRLGRSVALKLVPPELMHDDQLRERLSREARAAAALSHPGIAQVFSLEDIGGRLVLVSEFIDGHTLRAEMQGRPVPLPEVLEIGMALAEALAAAHTRGIVHRDLKPDNIMRAPDGRLKVLDFGLARWMEIPAGAPVPRLTRSGVAIGTPGYMSPEQRDGRPVDGRTDIYALGVLLSELATGGPAGIHGPEPGLASLSKGAPGLAAIVRRCLQRDPDERYPTADALRLDLAQLQRTAPDPRQTARARGQGDPRWWWRLHQAVILLAYTGSMGAAWWVHRSVPGLPGDIVFFGTLVAMAVGWTLRLHLEFVDRLDPSGLPAASRQSAPWLRCVDVWLALLLLLAAGLVLNGSPAIAAALAGSSLALLVASLVIEPSTTSAALKASRG